MYRAETSIVRRKVGIKEVLELSSFILRRVSVLSLMKEGSAATKG